MQKLIFVSYHYYDKSSSFPVYASRIMRGDCTSLTGINVIQYNLNKEKGVDVVILFMKELEDK